ncbi:MAG: sugar phosphate isomerase/epimerase [Defluviitaleaceae bacterium]|nr:sugar phosphate isomerase/epimerase [Defluviitaleaceae bacterium]
MKIGAQLYTVNQFTKTEADFEATIKKIADIGYAYVQISGIGPIPADKVRAICNKYGLKIIITHTSPDRVLNDTENVIKEHKIMGAGYIGIGGLPEMYKEDVNGINQFIADFTPPAKIIYEAGMKFMYHNHQFEFLKYDGKLIIDRLADGFQKEHMGFTLDTYWVQAGGGDPAYYLKKLAGRVDTIHFKDMSLLKVPGQYLQVQIMSEVLEGNLNWPEIFKACKDAGVKYAFVEQDDEYMTNPFECLKVSYNNLVKQGYK